MQKEQYVPTGKGLIALSPLMVFLMMYVGLSIFVGDFYTVPLSVAFVLSSVWGVATTARLPLSERLKVFSRGAANSDVIYIWYGYLSLPERLPCWHKRLVPQRQRLI